MPPFSGSTASKISVIVLRLLLMLDFGMLAFWPVVDSPLPWWVGEIGFILLGITLAVALSRLYRNSGTGVNNKNKEV